MSVILLTVASDLVCDIQALLAVKKLKASVAFEYLSQELQGQPALLELSVL